VGEKWDADPAAGFLRRVGKTAHELGDTGGSMNCPEIWELTNGDFGLIGADMSDNYGGRLPAGVRIDPGERFVVIPRNMLISAKPDIPDA
jgi:hypothetical protein